MATPPPCLRALADPQTFPPSFKYLWLPKSSSPPHSDAAKPSSPRNSGPPPLRYPGTPRSLGSALPPGLRSRQPAADERGPGRAAEGGARPGPVRSRAGGAWKGRCRGPDGAERAAFAAGAVVESCAPVPGPELGLGLGRLRCLKMAELGELKVPAPSPIPIWTEPSGAPSRGGARDWVWRARVGAGDVAGRRGWDGERRLRARKGLRRSGGGAAG